jgi:hypothetical protein
MLNKKGEKLPIFVLSCRHQVPSPQSYILLPTQLTSLKITQTILERNKESTLFHKRILNFIVVYNLIQLPSMSTCKPKSTTRY